MFEGIDVVEDGCMDIVRMISSPWILNPICLVAGVIGELVLDVGMKVFAPVAAVVVVVRGTLLM